ncbi:MAG: hypothetical protein ACXVEF_32160 [Polyangiales bacterium]
MSLRHGILVTVLLLGCPGPREPRPVAHEPLLASLVNETGEAIEITTLQSGAIVKCDAVVANEEAVVLAAIFAHPEIGDRANILKIPANASVELARGRGCAAMKIGEEYALVRANERLALRKTNGKLALFGARAHAAIDPPAKCAMEPLFFTPHMGWLMEHEWRVDAVAPESGCLAIDVAHAELRDRWKLCAPPGSWPFEKGATVKPYSHGTGLSFLGKGLNLVLEQPKLPMTDVGEVEIHVEAVRTGSPCSVPHAFDIAVPEGAVVVPASLAITVAGKKTLVPPNTIVALPGGSQQHHFAVQSAQHVLAVPSYFAHEGLFDRAAWVYWTTK